jgi:hypothetical protein
MSEIRDHIGQVMDRDPNARSISISFGECQVCRMPAGDHVQVRLLPYVPEGEAVPEYGDGRIRDHVARVPERDPREWFRLDVVGWCDECGSPAEMHVEVETVPRDQG